MNIKFGCQFTVNIALMYQEILKKMATVGLCYIFLGLESNDNKISNEMSKNKKFPCNGIDWIQRCELLINIFYSYGIYIGFSILFGLGENQHDRINLLKKIMVWQSNYKNFKVLSMNWAVQHPLKMYSNYTYVDWAVDIEDARYDLILNSFGEASTRYLLPKINMASLLEMQEISELYSTFQNNI